MTLAFFCVLIASILPLIWTGYAKVHSGFTMRDNANPRELLAQAQGAGKRANWAQANSWEAFAPFAAAVIIASMNQIDQTVLDRTAIVFIIARIIYGFCYIADWDKTRSVFWTIGMICNFYLYYLIWQN